MRALSKVAVGDDPEVWRRLGFTVGGRSCWVGGVEFVLTGDRSGIGEWRMAEELGESPEHPNGVTGLDHLVVLTPDLEESIEEFTAMGLQLRRMREAGEGRQQAFFRLGTPVLEVVGPIHDLKEPKTWGLAFTVRDLDAAAALLGRALHTPRDAVQPGRRIATVDRAAGSSTSIAFMSPQASGASADQR